jgi:hypothetical protein
MNPNLHHVCSYGFRCRQHFERSVKPISNRSVPTQRTVLVSIRDSRVTLLPASLDPNGASSRLIQAAKSSLGITGGVVPVRMSLSESTS